MRADSYGNLRDSILESDADPQAVGQRVILPATFTGGPRYIHERAQDAMAYVREFGRPDILTVTTNQLINKEKIFGPVCARLYSIEWQKRGLPHLHCIVWMAPDNKMRLQDIDAVKRRNPRCQ